MSNFQYIPSKNKHRVNRDGGPTIPAKIIVDVIENYYNLTLDQLMNKTRKREICYPRQVAMWCLAHYSALTLKSIAIIFQKRDHTTVVNSLESIDNYMKYDDGVKEQISEIVSKFNINGTTR
jgi:chromosomal replication initiator protein